MKSKRWLRMGAIACLACALAAAAGIDFMRVYAWWSGGHRFCTLAAAAKLPEDVPAFFRGAADELAEMSLEPDKWKSKHAPHLQLAEQPEHYIDLEYLEDSPLIRARYDLLKYYYFKNIDPAKGGFLPNAMQEGYERLLLTFHDYRLHPEDKALQQRIIVYAGWLAHYCQDAGMPLHTTKYYDGKPDAAGQVVHGIHAKIDAYPEKFLALGPIAEGLAAEPAADVWPVITRAIKESHKFVEQCYALDAEGGFDTSPEKARPLLLERVRASAKLTLDLWVSAWRNSDLH